MDNRNLNYIKILIFWIPLAAQWLMMSLEGPLLAAIIARMVEPKFNLAAYGVSLSLALVAESPVIMLVSASTALVDDRKSYLKLGRFALALNILVTLFMLIMALPQVFGLVAEGIIGLPGNVADLAYFGLLIMIPWPAAIGYRRFLHGILIKNDRTRFVAYGTVLRLICMTLTAFFFYLVHPIPGAWVASASLTVGVIFEAAAVRFMARQVIRDLLAQPDPGPEPGDLTYGDINRFYIPLALTTVLALGIRPLITIFLGQSRMALESLAALPVIHSLAFIFLALGLSYQEVGIALIGARFENYLKLRNFALILAVGTLAALGLIAFTPLARVWFQDISGLSPELTRFSIPPLKIMTILPGITATLFFMRSMLLNARRTVPLTWATVVEVSATLSIVFIGVRFLDLVGIMAAAMALVGGSLASNLYLLPKASSTLRSRSGG